MSASRTPRPCRSGRQAPTPAARGSPTAAWAGYARAAFAEDGIDVVAMPFSSVLDAIQRGDLVDAKTLVGLLLVRS